MEQKLFEDRAAKRGVPPHMIESMVAYINTGRPLGHFLSAIVSNDLAGACNRADEINQHLLYDYVVLLSSYAPAGCWGSFEAYTKWVSHRGMLFEGRDGQEQKQGSTDA